MKKLLVPFLSALILLSQPALAETKKTVPAKQTVKSVEDKKETYFKVEWFVKKTGKVVATRSSVINFSDPENQSKTGKIVLRPQRISVGNVSYLLGLGIDMKLFENKGSPILGMVGNYIDPNPLFDFTEKMPDEQNVAHPVITKENTNLPNNEVVNLYRAKFVKAYDLTQPNNQEITFTRFIIKESDTVSLIEISFKVYTFDVSEQDKPKG